MPWSDKEEEQAKPLKFPEASKGEKKPSWFASPSRSMRAPSFLPSLRPQVRSPRPRLDASRFANSAPAMPQGLRAPAVPREVRQTDAAPGRAVRASRHPSFRPTKSDVPRSAPSESLPEMTPPPLAPSLPPAVRARIEAQEAALREACAAAQEEREALADARHAFAEEAATLAAERRHIAWSLEGELIDLAVAMAEALVGSIDDTSLAPRLAKEALACLPEADETTLRVGSDAYEAICERYGATFTHEGTKVTLRLDDSMRGPGCLVESREAQVDARIHERLLLAARAMHEERATDEDRE